MILLAALVGAAVLSVNSARADIHFGVTVGVPAPVVVVSPAPVYYAGVVAPAPIVEAVPVCPSVDYVWAPGCWVRHDTGFMWMRGGWRYQPHYHYDYDRHYDRDDHFHYHHR